MGKELRTIHYCHYSSRTRINAGEEAKMLPLSELVPGPLFKSGMGPLARYGTYQDTIRGRPEQKYLPSDPRSEWPLEGPLLKPACFGKFQIAYSDI